MKIKFVGELHGDNCEYYFYSVDGEVFGTDTNYLYYENCTRVDETRPLTDREQEILEKIQ